MTSESALLVDPRPNWVSVNIEFVPSFVPSSFSKEDQEFQQPGDSLSCREILRKFRNKRKICKMLQESLSERSEEKSTPARGSLTPSAETPSPAVPTYVTVEVELTDMSNFEKGTEMTKSKYLRDVSKAKSEQHECCCRICAGGGPFVKCHTCRAVYYKTCMREDAGKCTADGTWRCPVCIYVNGKDNLRPDTETNKRPRSVGRTKRKPSNA